MASMEHSIDFSKLVKLRLLVARYGEMDNARWWNTNGILARNGSIVLSRGFPRTHLFAQARIAFAVARARCREIFNPPGCMTLWELPPQVEEQFESRWIGCLDEAKSWQSFVEQLETMNTGLLKSMRDLDLVTDNQVAEVGGLRRSAESRAVAVPGIHVADDNVLTLLAAGFSKGELGSPAIPYARLASSS
jgi:hypothetical protein